MGKIVTNENWGIRLLMVTLGLWVLLRSVNKDSSGRTLVNHILGDPGTNPNAGANPLPNLAAGANAAGNAAGNAISAVAAAGGAANPSTVAISSALDQVAATIRGTATAAATAGQNRKLTKGAVGP